MPTVKTSTNYKPGKMNYNCDDGRTSISKIVETMKDAEVMNKISKDWELLAIKLGITEQVIEKIRHDNIITCANPVRILEELLTNWRMNLGARANLVTLIKILEEGCKWLCIGKNIRENIKDIQEPTMSEHKTWHDLPFCFKGEVLGKQVEFLGRQRTLYQLTRSFPEATVCELLTKYVNGKTDSELTTSSCPVFAMNIIPAKIDEYIPRDLTRKTIQISGTHSTTTIVSDTQIVRKQMKKFNPEIICIAGDSGSGKRVLISTILRSVQQLYSDRFVIFLEYRDFMKHFHCLGEVSVDKFFEALSSYVSRSEFGNQLILQMLENPAFHFEIFLDTCNEVWYDKKKATLTNIFKSVVKRQKNIRFILTMRQETVALGGVQNFCSVLYGIEPLSKSECIQGLAKIWRSRFSKEHDDDLEKYAKFLITAIGSSLKLWEKDYVDNMIKIWLVSEVFAEHVQQYIVDETNVIPDLAALSLVKLYDKFLNQKFQKYSKKSYKTEHTKLAVIYCYPKTGQKTIPRRRTDIVTTDQLLEVGLLEGSNDKLSFIHKTFAEYLVAEYCAELLTQTNQSETQEKSIIHEVLDTSLATFTDNDGKITLKNMVVCRFLDEIMAEIYHKRNKFNKSSSTFSFVKLLPNLDNIFKSCMFHQHFALLCYLKQLDLPKNFVYDIKDLNSGSENWINAMIKASEYDVFEQVTNMIEKSVDVRSSFTQPFESPLWVDYGISLTPLHLVVQRGNFKTLEYLISKDENSKSKLPQFLLHVTVRNSFLDTAVVIEAKKKIIQYLFHTLGDKILNEHKGHFLPVPVLMHGIHFDILKLLIDKGADLMVKTNTAYNIAHNVTEYFTPNDYHNFVCLVLNRREGEIFRWRNANNETALEVALREIKVQVETLDLLLQKTEVDGDSTCRKLSLLSTVIKYGYEEGMLACVLRYKNVETEIHKFCKDGETTLLHVAVKSQNFAAAKYILSLGVWVDLKDENGKTPLHHALVKGYLINYRRQKVSKEMIILLLNNSANPTHKDNSGLPA